MFPRRTVGTRISRSSCPSQPDFDARVSFLAEEWTSPRPVVNGHLDTSLAPAGTVLTPFLRDSRYTSPMVGVKEVIAMLLVDSAIMLTAVALRAGLLFVYDRL